MKVGVKFQIYACRHPVFLASFTKEAAHSPEYVLGIFDKNCLAVDVWTYVLVYTEYSILCVCLNANTIFFIWYVLVQYLEFSMVIFPLLILLKINLGVSGHKVPCQYLCLKQYLLKFCRFYPTSSTVLEFFLY